MVAEVPITTGVGAGAPKRLSRRSVLEGAAGAAAVMSAQSLLPGVAWAGDEDELVRSEGSDRDASRGGKETAGPPASSPLSDDPHVHVARLTYGLQGVAQLLKADVGVRIAAVDYGDWDFHAALGKADAGAMAMMLGELGQSLAALAADLGPHLEHVTLVTMSEFGRRVAENGSGGVDHGHGNAMLVLGGRVKGGKVYGKWPMLAPSDLAGGNLAGTTDYRSVIGEVLVRCCGVGALSGIFPRFTPRFVGLA